MSEIKRIGVMTGGGDCPGLNAVIRAVTETAIMKYGLEVVGIKHGYRGLYLGGDEFVKLTLNDVSGVITKGGTMLYSSNKDNPLITPIRTKTVTNSTVMFLTSALRTLKTQVSTLL